MNLKETEAKVRKSKTREKKKKERIPVQQCIGYMKISKAILFALAYKMNPAG